MLLIRQPLLNEVVMTKHEEYTEALMEIMERGESQHSGIAIVWFCLYCRNTFASRGSASKEISLFFISYHNH